MNTTLEMPLASLGDLSLDAFALLHWLHRRGQLVPALRQAVAEEVCVHAARDAGLSVSAEQLQRAANEYRYRHALTSAEQTRTFLARQHLSVQDFEDSLERTLLVEQLEDHLAATGTDAWFRAHRNRYARVRLRELVVNSEGFARELLQQMTEERIDFADLARRHSLAPSRDQGGDLGTVCRASFPPPVAEAVFATPEGQIAGPLLAAGGYHLYRVEQHLPPELNEPTRALIRRELFASWLREHLAGVKFDLSSMEDGDRSD